MAEEVRQKVDSTALERAARRVRKAGEDIDRGLRTGVQALNTGKEKLEQVRSGEALSQFGKGAIALGIVGAGFSLADSVGRLVLENLRGKEAREQLEEFARGLLPSLLTETLPELLREEQRKTELFLASALEAERARQDEAAFLRDNPFFAREVDAKVQAALEARFEAVEARLRAQGDR